MDGTEASAVVPPLEREPLHTMEPGAVEQANEDGGVPQTLIDRLRRDVQQTMGQRSAILLRSAEVVEWPDSNYGCATAGQAAAAFKVPGYHVVFEVEGQRFDYRADKDGGFIQCEDKPPHWRENRPAS